MALHCAFLQSIAVLQAGTPLEAAAAAGERKQDVYMGIDVFGRGTFGGGQLNCNVAAAAARQQGNLLVLLKTLHVVGCVCWLHTSMQNFQGMQSCFCRIGSGVVCTWLGL